MNGVELALLKYAKLRSFDTRRWPQDDWSTDKKLDVKGEGD